MLYISTVANHPLCTYPGNVPLGETLLRVKRSSCVTTIQSKTDHSFMPEEMCDSSKEGLEKMCEDSVISHALSNACFCARLPSKQAIVSRLRAPTARARKIILFDCVSLKIFENNSRKIEKLSAALIGGAEITSHNQMNCLTSSPTLSIVRSA